MQQYKKCPKCQRMKLLASHFYQNPKTGNFASWCRKCSGKASTKSRNKNPELYRKLANKYAIENIFSTIRKNMKKTSQKRGWGKPLLTQDLYDKWDSQDGICYWSGLKMDRERGFRQNPKSVSADRLDGNKGYTKDNVVLCCLWANLGRSETPIDKWKIFLKEIKLKGLYK